VQKAFECHRHICDIGSYISTPLAVGDGPVLSRMFYYKAGLFGLPKPIGSGVPGSAPLRAGKCCVIVGPELYPKTDRGDR
jgi:hypothetical protein